MLTETTTKRLKAIIEAREGTLAEEHFKYIATIIENATILYGMDCEEFSITDQTAFRRFVKSFHAIPEHDQHILGLNLFLAFNPAYSIDSDQARFTASGTGLEIFQEIIEGLLEIPINKRGKIHNQLHHHAHSYLMFSLMNLCKSIGLIPVDSEDGDYYAVMKNIMEDDSIEPYLKLSDIRYWTQKYLRQNPL